MESFITWIFESFYLLFETLTLETVAIIDNAYSITNAKTLGDVSINLVLFSDTPIYTGDLWELLTLFFSVFYTIIFVICVWKIIKKVVVKITGWKRW